MEIVKAIGIAACVTGWVVFLCCKYEKDEHEKSSLRKLMTALYALAVTVAIIVSIYE